jgi:hypothetical protein
MKEIRSCFVANLFCIPESGFYFYLIRKFGRAIWYCHFRLSISLFPNKVLNHWWICIKFGEDVTHNTPVHWTQVMRWQQAVSWYALRRKVQKTKKILNTSNNLYFYGNLIIVAANRDLSYCVCHCVDTVSRYHWRKELVTICYNSFLFSISGAWPPVSISSILTSCLSSRINTVQKFMPISFHNIWTCLIRVVFFTSIWYRSLT